MKSDGIMQRVKVAARYAAPVLLTVGLLALVGAVGTALAAGNPLAGQEIPGGGIDTSKAPSTLKDFFDFLKSLIKWLLVFSLLIGVGAIIFGGIRYVTAGGNAESAKAGTHIIGYALVGIAVMVLAFTLVNVVASIVVGKDIGGIVN